jgi:hypothetical protein
MGWGGFTGSILVSIALGPCMGQTDVNGLILC